MAALNGAVRAVLTSFGIAALSIREQRYRSLLSALGIAVASIAILLLISVAKGVQNDLTKEVNDLGVNVLVVLPARIEEDSLFNPQLMGISSLSETDIARIRAVPGVKRAVPVTFVGGGVSHGGKTSGLTLVIASEPDWFAIRATGTAEGRPFLQSEEHEPVCVLGAVVKERLFGSGPAVGSSIEHNGVGYRVVGVTSRSSMASQLFQQGGFDNMVVVPYRYIRSTREDAAINRIFIQTEPEREPSSLVSAIDRTLGQRLERESYSVLTQQDLLKLVFKLMSVLTWLLTGLTSIALFVGGIGIMTVMLMSVGERTKEIGIRKTVGARRSDIFVQFLTESVLLALAGGIAGLAASALAAEGLTRFTPLKPMLTGETVLLALLVCVGVGAVFGLLPAMRAATRDPVSSLRYE